MRDLFTQAYNKMCLQLNLFRVRKEPLEASKMLV